MTSDKKSIALLAEIFIEQGLRYIVVSPGSRNAPIILSFADNPQVKVISIIDERSAAFFALGMAQQIRQPVAVACTSGTAVLNYAPAIAEAYYQKVPLLILTADRPDHLIDQGEGQTIRQKKIFKNYIKGSFELTETINDENEFGSAVKLIYKAYYLSVFPDYGPVHINLPFSEPLYNRIESHKWEVKPIKPRINLFDLKENDIATCIKGWNHYSKKLLIAGMMVPNPVISRLIDKVIDDPSVVLLSETTSNLAGCSSISSIDKVVSTILPGEYEEFKPELLVTFGGNVVSKMIKDFIRKNKPVEHWNIDPVDHNMNTYQCLTRGIQTEPYIFFREIADFVKKRKSNFREIWFERNKRSEYRHDKFLSNCPFSDLKVFETILNAIPENSHVQLGNSTPVRYAQLFSSIKMRSFFSNRGTSGIDGSVSTSAGACYATIHLTTLIVGDLGFLYDSNALMNDYLCRKLRIIIINNSGGGIFRFIPGPAQTGNLLRFFDTKHNWSAKYIAKNFNVKYLSAKSLSELKSSLEQIYLPESFYEPVILEVFTPTEQNEEILKAYFNYLRH